MRTFTLLLATGSAAIAAPANAATISQSFFATGGPNVTPIFTVTPFNPSLGTLESVTVSYTGTSRFLVPLNGPPSAGATYELSNFFTIFIGPLFFDSTATGSGPIAGPGPIELVSNVTVPDVTTRSDAFALNVFQSSSLSGSVQFDPPQSNRITVTGASINLQAIEEAGGTGSGTITYTYAPVGGPAIPEPATWAMMIAGFGLLGAKLRQQARRVTIM